jgi:putative FmdB family regulatory protein
MTAAICSNEVLTPMPLYEYECDRCAHRFEIIQKFSDPPIEKCPTCGGPVHKLMSSPAFQFKGSGWYVTDYPKKDQAGGTKTDQGESAAAGKEKKEQKEKSEKAEKPDTSSSAASDSAAPSSSTPSTTPSTTPKSKD